MTIDEMSLVELLSDAFAGMSIKILVPRFANTLCLAAHLRMASDYGRRKSMSVEIRFIDWDDRLSTSEAIQATVPSEPDMCLLYASRQYCRHVANGSFEADNANIVSHSLPFSRFLPRYFFVPKHECVEHGIRDFESAYQVIRNKETFVYTDHNSLAQRMFRGFGDNLALISGTDWNMLQNQRFYSQDVKPQVNLFFVSAPATAECMRRETLQPIEIPASDKRLSSDEFITELLVMLGPQTQCRASVILDAFSEYHRGLFSAVENGSALHVTGRCISSALAPRFPDFAYAVCLDSGQLTSCLLRHHGGIPNDS